MSQEKKKASEFVEVCFDKNGHNSGHKSVPDMILTAFDWKFNEKKDQLPPEICRPIQKLIKNIVGKVDPQQVENKQCRKSAS